jgi:hypothetical protein
LLKVRSLHVRVNTLTFCPKGASFSATAASVAFWALLKVRSKQKEASFSATAASVVLWALLKVRLNSKHYCCGLKSPFMLSIILFISSWTSCELSELPCMAWAVTPGGGHFCVSGSLSWHAMAFW